MEEENKKKEKREKRDNDNSEEDNVELHPAEEQGILPEQTSEEKEAAMEHGEKDEDIYTKEGREKLEEDAEIEPWEEGFMEGASGTGQLSKDALTGEPLMDIEDVIELQIDGTVYRFVNQENAEKFKEKKQEEEEN
jgi:hypothetical protein